jgi:hypothetical protein
VSARTQAVVGASPLSLAVDQSESILRLRMAGDFDLAAIGQVMVALDRLDVESTALLRRRLGRAPRHERPVASA